MYINVELNVNVTSNKWSKWIFWSASLQCPSLWYSIWCASGSTGSNADRWLGNCVC